MLYGHMLQMLSAVSLTIDVGQQVPTGHYNAQKIHTCEVTPPN